MSCLRDLKSLCHSAHAAVVGLVVRFFRTSTFSIHCPLSMVAKACTKANTVFSWMYSVNGNPEYRTDWATGQETPVMCNRSRVVQDQASCWYFPFIFQTCFHRFLLSLRDKNWITIVSRIGGLQKGTFNRLQDHWKWLQHGNGVYQHNSCAPRQAKQNELRWGSLQLCFAFFAAVLVS